MPDSTQILPLDKKLQQLSVLAEAEQPQLQPAMLRPITSSLHCPELTRNTPI